MAEILGELGITPYRLAKTNGVPPRHVNEIVRWATCNAKVFMPRGMSVTPLASQTRTPPGTGVIAAPEPQAPGPAPNRPPPGRRSSSCDTGRPYPSRPLAARLLGGSLRLPPRGGRAGSFGDRPASQPAPRSGGHGGAARRPTRRLDADQPCNPSIPISPEAPDPDAERELPPGRPNWARPRSRHLAASLNSVKVSVQIDAT